MEKISVPSSALPNPLREGLVEERIPEPATMVIFGASGDLARRKLLPALYSLTRDRLLPARFAVLGFGRHAQDDDAFREEMRRGCDEFARRRPVDAPLWAAFARNLFYQQGAYDDPAAFQRLKVRLEEIERTLGLPGNRVFYLSTPPSAFAPVIRSLGQADLAPQAGARQAVRARDHREAVRRRPGDGARAEPPGPRDPRRAADLPHRPLPRKRDGPEPAGVPVRQRDLRAALEQPLRRPRPDHRVGDGRRRGARRLLRAGRQHARHGAEPPAPGLEPGRDGAAGRLRSRRGEGRKAQGLEGAAPHS